MTSTSTANTPTAETSTATSVVEGLRAAIEGRDADRILALYADDATLTLHDRDHPPSNPAVFRGSEAIRDYYRDICGRNIHHEVRDAVAAADGLAFTQHCTYPDGAAVLCLTVAHTQEGKIISQTGLQVWDG